MKKVKITLQVVQTIIIIFMLFIMLHAPDYNNSIRDCIRPGIIPGESTEKWYDREVVCEIKQLFGMLEEAD